MALGPEGAVRLFCGLYCRSFAVRGLYVVFFSIVFAYYACPLHIVRELWASYVQLRQRFQAFKKYRALTANMDERFPPATEEEIREAGGICIICRDDMSEGRRLPCGHVFHFACLRLWLQQQQSARRAARTSPSRRRRRLRSRRRRSC